MAEVPTCPPEEPAEHKKEKHTGTRLAVAFGAWEVGNKIGLLGGSAIDVGRLLKEVEGDLTFKERFGIVWSDLQKVAAKEKNPVIGWVKAAFHMGKYSTLLGVGVGSVFAALGWVRAEKLGSPQQIFHRPIHSLKILIGIENPPEPVAVEPMPLMSATDSDGLPQRKFTDSIQPKASASYAEAVSQQQAQASAMGVQ